MFSSEVAWCQILGTRKNQQDYVAAVRWPNGFRLLLLADGMGGHAAGDLASKLVVETFKEYFCQSDEPEMRKRLIDSLDTANVELYNQVKENPELSGMGTTLIALVFDGLSVQWLSVGDSPLWLIRGNKIDRINENHSMVELLKQKVASGEITQSEADQSKSRSQLLEAIMGENIEMLDAPETAVELEVGDLVVLASDGVESLTNEEILHASQPLSRNIEEVAMCMLDAVVMQKRESQDNASLAILKVQKADLSEPDSVAPEGRDIVMEPKTKNSDMADGHNDAVSTEEPSV